MSLHINISVDWEGHYLHSLYDFVAFRKKHFAEIPFTHYMCPNYFLKKKKSKIFDEIILPQDEIALHLHSWKSLVQTAGVKFKTDNNYFESYLNSAPKFLKILLISGRGVPITVYNYEELHKLITFSKQLLEDTFEVKVQGFRAGGWIANKDVFKILEELDFLYDSSAVAPEILSEGFGTKSDGNFLDNYGDNMGLFAKQIVKLWGNSVQTDGYLENAYRNQFHKGAIDITTQAFKVGNLVELPNNGGMSDFASVEKTFSKQISAIQNGFISIGCHQEGEIHNKQALVESQKYLAENNIFHTFVTAKDYAKTFLSSAKSDNCK